MTGKASELGTINKRQSTRFHTWWRLSLESIYTAPTSDSTTSEREASTIERGGQRGEEATKYADEQEKNRRQEQQIDKLVGATAHQRGQQIRVNRREATAKQAVFRTD